jgi:hypothetical protein
MVPKERGRSPHPSTSKIAPEPIGEVNHCLTAIGCVGIQREVVTEGATSVLEVHHCVRIHHPGGVLAIADFDARNSEMPITGRKELGDSHHIPFLLG